MATLDSDQSGAFAMVIPDQNMVKWHLKTINATYNDIIVCYRWDLDEWMVDTNKIFQDGVFFKNQAYTVSGISPTLFKDEYGYTDNNAPIQFEYNKIMDFGEPFFLKELWQSRTFLSINDV